MRFDDRGVLHDRMAGEPHAKEQHTFYRELSMFGNAQLGLQMNSDTMKWWFTDAPAAARVSVERFLGGFDCVHIQTMMNELDAWVKAGPEVHEWWCLGASFDFAFLNVAYDRAGRQPPWHYRKLRCARTLFELVQMPHPPGENAHNALADATRDARHTAHCLRVLHEWKERTQMPPIDAHDAAFEQHHSFSANTPAHYSEADAEFLAAREAGADHVDAAVLALRPAEGVQSQHEAEQQHGTEVHITGGLADVQTGDEQGVPTGTADDAGGGETVTQPALPADGGTAGSSVVDESEGGNHD